MKTRKNAFLASILILAATFICNQSYAQEINTNRIQVRKGIPEAPVVAIKVYNDSNGAFTLLAYNPQEHSLAFYDNDDYSITWIREGQIMPSSNVIINNVCGEVFQVLVLNKNNGTIGKARIYGLPCPTEDRPSPGKYSIQ